MLFRAVLGIKGEPSTPDDASQGKVWQSIVRQIDGVGSQDEYTSTADILVLHSILTPGASVEVVLRNSRIN